MLTPGVTGWSDVAPVLLTAVALLFLPGLVAARLAGIAWFNALGFAPVLSTSIVVAGGVTAAAMRLPWGLRPMIIMTAMVWATVAAGQLVASALRRRRARRRGLISSLDSGSTAAAVDGVPGSGGSDGHVRLDAARTSVSDWLVLAGSLACTLFAVGIVLVRASRSPEAFPQHPDTIFHLGTAQWMAEHHDISVLHAFGFLSPTGTGGYPAAFHAMTATVTLLTGVPAVVATSCFVLVAAGLAWPAALVILARSLFGARPSVTMGAAAGGVLFTAFPFMLMGFGVLWPNLYGEVLLPSVLALGAAVLAPLNGTPAVTGPVRAALVLVAALPGLTLAHPNALLSFMHLGVLAATGAFAAAAWYRRRTRQGQAWLLGTTAVILPLGFAAVLTVVRPPSMVDTGKPGPELDSQAALIDTLTFAPRNAGSLTLLASVVLLGGLVILVRHRGARWLPLATLYFAALFYLNVAVDSPEARYLTWPWYNNAVRLAAVGVVPAALLAAAAFDWAATLVSRPARRWGPRRRVLANALASALVLGVFVGATSGGYAEVHERWLRPFFHPNTRYHWWATPRELRALHELGRLIPKDAVTAANPWNGGTYLYVVSGRRLLVPTEKGLTLGDRRLLAATLDQAGKDPYVCEAARRQHVEYAIVGGTPFAWATGDSLRAYGGIDGVGRSSAFTPVAHAGPYTLYRLTRCAAG